MGTAQAQAQTQPRYQLGERLPEVAASTEADSYRSLGWNALMPKNWNPAQAFEGLDFSALSDADPRATEALKRLQQAWEQAPVESSLDRQRVRMTGFVVPLDGSQGMVREFLLVPYYGACIHTPPPPANQIVHVKLATPSKEIKLMDSVAVTGLIRVQHSKTEQGASGYTLSGDSVAPFQARKRRS
ncbi:MAG: hypothetical protein A2486_10470 [Burkholderiales bacterium RIFOXYC12_FULL_65_23]|nr:MAG: hypothetical protein A2486_10470 [Burkholderiales bacterium RIFOXYC12_FULL_65_23]